jgi:hypothetical protein
MIRGQESVCWVRRQVTLRMRGQDGLTKKEEDERSEDNVWITMQQKGVGQMEGHEWVIEEK